MHVAIASAEEGVAALDRIRPWLAPLLALSTNSPFWNGTDSGYASYRSQVWGRWPSTGPTELFGDPAGYQQVVRTMLDTDTVLDEGMLYFDARLSRTHPTVEIRVADVCREPDDAVLIAGLTRALVETAVREWQAGSAPDPVRTEVLRLAGWQAARSGLDGTLLDPADWRAAPAAAVLQRLVEHVTPALLDAGDLDVVRELLAPTLARNTGAARQRAVLERTGDLRAVVADAVDADGGGRSVISRATGWKPARMPRSTRGVSWVPWPRPSSCSPRPRCSRSPSRTAPGEPDIHVHAGGQGVWQARMLSSLGVRVVLCAGLGGEAGERAGAPAAQRGRDPQGDPDRRPQRRLRARPAGRRPHR